MNGAPLQSSASASKKSWLWIIIIVLVIAVLTAIYYFRFYSKTSEKISSEEPIFAPQSSSDETSAIEADLNATRLDDLDKGLNDVGGEL